MQGSQVQLFQSMLTWLTGRGTGVCNSYPGVHVTISSNQFKKCSREHQRLTVAEKKVPDTAVANSDSSNIYDI